MVINEKNQNLKPAILKIYKEDSHNEIEMSLNVDGKEMPKVKKDVIAAVF
jgi:hypothetical protein